MSDLPVEVHYAAPSDDLPPVRLVAEVICGPVTGRVFRHAEIDDDFGHWVLWHTCELSIDNSGHEDELLVWRSVNADARTAVAVEVQAILSRLDGVLFDAC